MVPFLALIGATAAVVAGLGLVGGWARRHRRIGSALSSAMAAYDEAMHPLGHEAAVEARAAEDRMPVVPIPGRR